MNQQRDSGGRQQGGEQQRQYNQNDQITKEQRLHGLLSALSQRRDELSAVLPPDITFDAFHATINQALRANPDLLDCTPRSLVNACVKAAYDGLRVDGKEAAIVWEITSIPGTSRKEKTARYMPMYQGLVQQVLRGGLVLSCEADVIYENDKYRVLRGSDSGIYHEPLLDGDRGRMIAAYNIARLKSGVTTFAYLTREQIDDIARESKSGWDSKDGTYKGVWRRWTREQWKKTVMRQHRKTLPVGERTVIRDMETLDEFPQFGNRQQPHPQFVDSQRPTRAAISDQAGTGNGVDMDFGRQQDPVVVDRDQQQERGGQQQMRQEQDDRGGDREQQQRDPDVELPEDERAWAAWSMDIEKKIDAAKAPEEIDRAWSDAAPVMKHASKAIRDRLTSKMTDRTTVLALGDDGDDAED